MLNNFRIISKLPAQPQTQFTARDVETWEQAISPVAKCASMASTPATSSPNLRKPGGRF